MDDPKRKSSWIDVIREHLAHSKGRISENGYFSPSIVDTVSELLPNFSPYFSSVQPLPFLDDATTKNVLIHNGQFSGIIDFDSICFGDDLYVIALTKMSLLESQNNISYIDHWVSIRGLTAHEQKALDLYTLIFCLDFMGEKGMKFNREVAPIVRKEAIDLLHTVYNNYLAKVVA